MTPIDYIPIMQAHYRRSGLGEYPLYAPADRPLTPLAKPLRECRLALVCSAGISRRDQPPFRRLGADDFSVREIPVDTRPEELRITYDYFDHADADVDINCLFPLTRLRELASQGAIGAVCDPVYAMGIGRWRQPATPERLQGEVAEGLRRRCLEQRADAVLLVPG
ncbi:MAG: glycine/sarcosine/betaine reductase selenoprotein B family protein [Chloroflexota bacterium]